ALSQAAARFVFSKGEVIEVQIKQIIEERERLFHALAQTPGIEVFPSEANFLLFRTKANGSSIFWGLLEEGVLIRDLSSTEGLQNCLRVTVGMPEENDLFLKALRKVLKKMEER
ncbi:MAG: aminotransferase class I/II-fold pyridoxal phosphate-dependent enzyme, partial [Candidatus Methylomirabilales bacterium]